MDRRSFFTSVGAACLVSSLAWGATPSGAYEDLLDAVLTRSPETATGLGLDTGARRGLKRRLNDRSLSNRLGYYEAVIAARDAIAALPAETADARTQRDTVVWLADAMAPFQRFGYGGVGGFDYPVPYVVSQLTGAYQALPDFLDSQHTVTGLEDAGAYLDRLEAFGPALDIETQRLRADAARGVAPPDFLIDRTLSQMESFQKAQSGPMGAMAASLARRAAAAGLGSGWGEKAQKLVSGPIAEALARQKAAIAALRPGARTEAGVGALPQGEAYYAAALRFHTSTSLSPDAAHQLGLDQVAQVSAEARAVLDAHGVTRGTVSQGIKALWDDPAQRFPDTDAGRADLLAFIAGLESDMKARLPRVFDTLPKTRLEVRRVPVELELGSPGAYSQSGSVDGTRPGAIYFNLHDTANWPRWAVPTTAYHEGLPGHHLQGSIANETTGMPILFKLLSFNAYNEGWALYAEQLADELGAYDALPLGRLGRLQGSLFRACRIVVDTGLHARGWSRERAIAYLIENAGETAEDARREVERYCAWPGQACGYKIGHLEFLRLRAVARARLGARFDIKRFHDTVLLHGSLPLTVMADAVDAWIEATARG